MKSLLTIAVVAYLATTAGIAHGLGEGPQQRSKFDLGAEVFLLKDKTLAGFEANINFNRSVGLHLGLGFIVAADGAPRHNIDNSFLGNLFGGHLTFRLPVGRNLDARIGTGIDAWLLYGIAAGETKYAWPIYAEGRFAVSGNLAVFLRGRYYITRSDGLLVGETYEGSGEANTVPLFSIGAVYVF